MSPDGPEIRRLLPNGRPCSEEAVGRVLTIVREGGHVGGALAEADRRIETATAAVAEMPQSEVTEVFTRLGEYLVARVAVARTR